MRLHSVTVTFEKLIDMGPEGVRAFKAWLVEQFGPYHLWQEPMGDAWRFTRAK